MRYWRITFMVLACVAFANFAAAATLDLTTGAAASETVSSGWLPRDDGNVLWDLTHGVFLSYEPAGSYADLAALLAANGHVVTTTSAGLDNVDLSPYDVIVICLGSAWESPYTASEVATVLDFIGDGGGVLVLADNPACPNANLGPLTEALGTSCGVADAQDAVSNFAAHPIFSGVNALQFTAAGQLAAAAPSQLVAWDVGNGPVIAPSIRADWRSSAISTSAPRGSWTPTTLRSS